MYSKDKILNFNKIDYKKISEKLRHFRQMENYTQAYVAGKLGISRQSYNHYEAGRVNPDINILFSLSELYQIPFECLFEGAASHEHSFLTQLEKKSAYSKEFIDFFNVRDNMVKYHCLSRKEKQLIFYFQQLSDDIQKDFLNFIYLKYLYTL